MLNLKHSLQSLLGLKHQATQNNEEMSGLLAVLDFLQEVQFSDEAFFDALDEAIRKLIQGSTGIHVLVHHGTHPQKWIPFHSKESRKLAVSAQLFFLKGDQPAYSIESDSPLFKHLVPAEELTDLRKAVLFRIRKRHYLLLLTGTDELQAETKSILVSYLSTLENLLFNQGKQDDQGTHILRLREELQTSRKKLHEAERGLRRRAYEIDNILEISTELYSILDLPQLLNSALLILVGQIGCEKAFALLRPPEGGDYSEQYNKGFGEEPFDFIMNWKHPLVDYLTKRKQPVNSADLFELPGMKPFVDQFKQEQIQILAPLVYSDRLLGIVGCGNKIFGNAFDDHDLQLFSILANIISVSVSNAQMYQNVRKMSLTDAMTDLNNYRSFKERLKEEINRAKRKDSCVSLLMIDIDHFKNYNDSLGHQAGDEALRQLGGILKLVSRDEDIVNRYGGEEFTIILPGLPKDSMHILAERIRVKVEEEEFYSQEIQPLKRLTISIGGASLPDDADNFDSLVRCADEAMYKSKQNGRNRFTLYQ